MNKGYTDHKIIVKQGEDVNSDLTKQISNVY